jgi:DNA modification methylase
MIRIMVGDCIASMKKLKAEAFNCCVTSPPYFGLRDYGHEGQIGLESSPDEYVAKLVEVFREVKRVLRDDGTLWLNIGDSYNGSGGQGSKPNIMSKEAAKGRGGKPIKVDGIKPKDLIGVPWMLAFALRKDGWYLRQDIIWHKPNPMPESVTDRCTKAHEYVFLFSKSAQYYYNNEAIQEPALCTTYKSVGRETRNKRSVWSVQPHAYEGAHFATFPPDLIEPCILAGCPEGGTVLDPFGGSGTTGLVAQRFDRVATLCELNVQYAALAEKRIRDDSPMFSKVHVS